MILIQLVLIVAIVALMIRFLSSRGSNQTQAWKKLLLMLFTALAIIFVVWPESLNTIAHFVGVGRGADLLLYSLIVAFVFQSFNTYLKGKEEQRRFAKVASKVAILEARLNNK